MKKERKHYTAEEKVAILRRHLIDRVQFVLLRPFGLVCNARITRRSASQLSSVL